MFMVALIPFKMFTYLGGRFVFSVYPFLINYILLSIDLFLQKHTSASIYINV